MVSIKLFWDTLLICFELRSFGPQEKKWWSTITEVSVSNPQSFRSKPRSSLTKTPLTFSAVLFRTALATVSWECNLWFWMIRILSTIYYIHFKYHDSSLWSAADTNDIRLCPVNFKKPNMMNTRWKMLIPGNSLSFSWDTSMVRRGFSFSISFSSFLHVGPGWFQHKLKGKHWQTDSKPTQQTCQLWVSKTLTILQDLIALLNHLEMPLWRYRD